MSESKTPNTEPPTPPPDLLADLPGLYLKHPLTSFPSDWLDVSRAWWASGRWSLYLFSSANGTGKSCFACSLLRGHRESLIRKGAAAPFYWPGNQGGRWVSMPTFIPIIRDLTRWCSYRDQLARSPLVVIDDLAAGRNTPHVVEELVLLLMRRYEEGKRTIITSNLSLNDVAAVMDRRLASRLQDGFILQAGSADLRARGPKGTPPA